MGERGRRETVRELRLEFVCPARKLADVLASIRAHHSYEEPAIDVYPLHEIAGRWHATDRSRPDREAMAKPAVSRNSPLLAGSSARARSRGDRRRSESAGPARRRRLRRRRRFPQDAARAGADVLLTGEARFHRALEAEALGIGLLTAGHYATERPGIEELAEKIALAFPSVTVWPSRDERDPIRLVGAGDA